MEEQQRRIEGLEKENKELRQYLQESQSQYQRMEARDELILQYECEIKQAQIRLQKCN